MKIAVVSMRGGEGAGGLFAEFDAAGGTIGRAKTNALVLDDPDRTVSRVHAQVIFRNGAFFIQDQGSNPLLCNGISLGAGNEAMLSNGDRLQIGGFELLVSQNASGLNPAVLDDLTIGSAGSASSPSITADDPFADLLAGLTPASAPAPVANSPNVASIPDFFPDPMGFDSPAIRPGKVDPFDDLMGLGGASTATETGLDGLSNASSSSIDDLFGLGPSSGGADPFALSPLASPLIRPNTASSADPLQALLDGGSKSTAASRSDHVPVLQQAYTLPTAVDAKPPAVLPPAPAHVAVSSMVAAPVARPIPPPTPRSGTASDSDLLAAFLRGVQSTHQMPTELTPELMERIGGLLHSATHGTVQLLQSRQEFKRGVRSEVTMISVEANNPLKFSPTAEVALAHMLGPRIKGFMGPEQAMSNAYADLRAHQFAVMVGIRAALAHVLNLFTPDKLESRLTEKTTLDALFSANRKAKLWDQFCKLYAGIATEAEDDFHALFGEAFAKAYDEQMARFKFEK
jgi:type VI secretion system FHA domain protein